MAARKTTRKRAPTKTKSWKDIDQAVKPKAMSEVTRRRVIATRVKWVAGLLAVAGCAAFAFKATVYSDKGAELLANAGDALIVRTIDIQNVGVIGDGFVLDNLGLRGELDLLKLDIEEMQKRLLSIGQIVDASIQCKFPDELLIVIEERDPIARLRARDVTGEIIDLLVDREGIVYEGMDYEARFLRSLPALGGVVLRREGDGYARVAGMQEVDALLSEAKMIAPHLYRSWRIVSLERSPQIIARSKMAKEVVFDPGNYRRELARLDYILDYYKGAMVKEVASIDLTLGTQVPVRATMQ